MQSIDEKRVYGDRSGVTTVYVATDVGVVRVLVSGTTVGEFGLLERCTARDIAAGVDVLAVATDEDVLVCRLETGGGNGVGGEDGDGDERSTLSFEPTGFGPAVAVGVHQGAVLAADEDGVVARYELESETGSTATGDWLPLEYGTDAPAPSSVRSIAGDLLATDVGVFRDWDGRLEHAGLTDVRDVSAAGVPLAATAEGLYKLGNGWMKELDGSVDLVCADPVSEPGSLARAHAVVADEWYVFADGSASADASSSSAGPSATTTTTASGEWTRVEDDEAISSSDPIAGVAYGEAVYAVTTTGTVLAADTASADDPSWRAHTIGISGVCGLAVPLAASPDRGV
ncbi:hypothetical protein ACLI4Q_00275 [Natrialbaceae archaeon A-CW1-1]